VSRDERVEILDVQRRPLRQTDQRSVTRSAAHPRGDSIRLRERHEP